MTRTKKRAGMDFGRNKTEESHTDFTKPNNIVSSDMGIILGHTTREREKLAKTFPVLVSYLDLINLAKTFDSFHSPEV